MVSGDESLGSDYTAYILWCRREKLRVYICSADDGKPETALYRPRRAPTFSSFASHGGISPVVTRFEGDLWPPCKKTWYSSRDMNHHYFCISASSLYSSHPT